MDEEKIYRQKVLKIGASSIGICLLIAYWWATQSVAAECNYHGFLGGGFTYLCAKNMKKETTHGSASFATIKEIDEAGLGQYEDKTVAKEREWLRKLLQKMFGNEVVKKIKS